MNEVNCLTKIIEAAGQKVIEENKRNRASAWYCENVTVSELPTYETEALWEFLKTVLVLGLRRSM